MDHDRSVRVRTRGAARDAPDRPSSVLRLGMWAAGGAFALLVAAVAWAQDAPEADATPASSGVYTADQAERGAETFAASCAGCHGADLSGDFGPRLVPLDPWRWSDATLAELHEFVRTNMPFGAPGSLSDEAYLDLIAFLLSENGHPPGDAPLVADVDSLSSVVLDDPPAADAAEEPEEVPDEPNDRY